MLLRTAKSIIVVPLFLCWTTVSSSPAEKHGPALVKSHQEGTYRILQMDKEIGTQEFKIKIYDNNSLQIECRQLLSVTGKDTFKEESSLLVEEDSYFPKRYTSKKQAKNYTMQLQVDMVANVGVFKTKTPSTETTETRVYPAGSLCLPMGLVSYLSQLLYRYNDKAGGKQRILTFDPVSKLEEIIVVESSAPLDTTIAGVEQQLYVYKIQRDKGREIMIYMDGEENMVKVVDVFQRMEYILSAIKKDDK